MDEAGISNPAHEPWVTMAGVIVHGDEQLADVTNELAKVRKKHLPEETGFVLQAKHIFNGSNYFKRGSARWPIERRMELAMDIAAILPTMGLPLAVGAFASASPTLLQNTRHWKTMEALRLSFLACSFLVEGWMRKNKPAENCILIIEDNASARTLIRQFQNEHQQPDAASGYKHLSNAEWITNLLPFRHIHEDPLFQSKRADSPLVLADFCAHVSKRWFVDRNHPIYGQLYRSWSSCVIDPKVVTPGA